LKKGLEAWLPDESVAKAEYEALSPLEKIFYEPDNLWGIQRGAWANVVAHHMDMACKTIANDIAKRLFSTS
jgi:hypothetical protein